VTIYFRVFLIVVSSTTLMEGEELGSNLLHVHLRSPARNPANGSQL
jgi:hypothetical protein